MGRFKRVAIVYCINEIARVPPNERFILSGRIRCNCFSGWSRFVILDRFLNVLPFLFVAEVFPVEEKDGEEWDYVDANERRKVNQVDSEVVFAHPHLYLKSWEVDHCIDGKWAANCDTVAQSERDKSEFEESALSGELCWREDTRKSPV